MGEDNTTDTIDYQIIATLARDGLPIFELLFKEGAIDLS